MYRGGLRFTKERPTDATRAQFAAHELPDRESPGRPNRAASAGRLTRSSPSRGSRRAPAMRGSLPSKDARDIRARAYFISLSTPLDPAHVAVWRNRDNRARVGLRFNVSRRRG